MVGSGSVAGSAVAGSGVCAVSGRLSGSVVIVVASGVVQLSGLVEIDSVEVVSVVVSSAVGFPFGSVEGASKENKNRFLTSKG